MIKSPASSEIQTAPATTPVRRAPRATTPLILVVEDDEDSRIMLRHLLEHLKYRVIEAADGLAAVKLAGKMRPDLVLMDIKMPHLDGFEATRRIRAANVNNRVPIIFVSGYGKESYECIARKVGADDYLVKPLEFDLLERLLDKYVPLPQSNAKLRSPLTKAIG